MKRFLLISTVLLGAGLAAQAGVMFNFGVGVPFGPPAVVSQPAPVYVAPSPAYYPPTAPVAVAPSYPAYSTYPVAVVSSPYVFGAGVYGYPYWHGPYFYRGWGHYGWGGYHHGWRR